MPWRPMRLRGAKVLARCDEAGELCVVEGRVEIRYRASDGRAYRAAARNLEALPVAEIFADDHCVPAVEAAAPSSEGSPGAGQRETRTPRAGGRGASRSGAAGAGPPPPPPERVDGNELVFYADGACSGNPGPAGLGVVMLSREVRRELSEFLGDGTNNIAELTAILRAAEQVDDPGRPVRIYTDSSYAIGVLTRGWRAKANQALVARVRGALDGLNDVRLHHVRGHAGVPLNERADELARRAVDARATTGWSPFE